VLLVQAERAGRVLGIDAENPTGALRLYEKHGFRPRYMWAVVRKPY